MNDTSPKIGAAAPLGSSRTNETPSFSYIAGGCNVSLSRWVYLAAACAQMLLVAGLYFRSVSPRYCIVAVNALTQLRSLHAALTLSTLMQGRSRAG